MPTALPPRAGWPGCWTTHARGAEVVGGSLDLPPDLSLTARCDYYCGWYHVHSRRQGGEVTNHPPGNLSVRRDAFARTGGFTEQQPIAYSHEELAWQAAVRRAGGRIVFEPAAASTTTTAPGSRNLLRRNYRWGYSAIESKAPTGAARMAWVYRHPGLLVLGGLPIAIGTTVYIVGCWAARAGAGAAAAAARRARRPARVLGGPGRRRRPLDAPRRGCPAARPRWE